MRGEQQLSENERSQHENFNKEHAKDFEAWRRELYGDDVVGTESAAKIYQAMRLRADGRVELVRGGPLEIPVDKYGLPAGVKGNEPTVREQLDLRWDAALLEDPYAPPYVPRPKGNWRIVKSQRAAMLLDGELYRGHDTERYIHKWMRAGFTPELYCLLHAKLESVVERCRSKAKWAGREDWFEGRLAELNLSSGSLGANGANLNPEHWQDLPGLLVRLPISVGVEKILLLGM